MVSYSHGVYTQFGAVSVGTDWSYFSSFFVATNASIYLADCERLRCAANVPFCAVSVYFIQRVLCAFWVIAAQKYMVDEFDVSVVCVGWGTVYSASMVYYAEKLSGQWKKRRTYYDHWSG